MHVIGLNARLGLDEFYWPRTSWPETNFHIGESHSRWQTSDLKTKIWWHLLSPFESILTTVKQGRSESLDRSTIPCQIIKFFITFISKYKWEFNIWTASYFVEDVPNPEKGLPTACICLLTYFHVWTWLTVSHNPLLTSRIILNKSKTEQVQTELKTKPVQTWSVPEKTQRNWMTWTCLEFHDYSWNW